MSPLISFLLLALVASSSAASVLQKQVQVKIDLQLSTISLDTINCTQCSVVNTVAKVIALPASLIPTAKKFVLNAAFIAQCIAAMVLFVNAHEVTVLVLIGFNIASIAGGALTAFSNLQSLDVAYCNINSLSPNSLPSTLITLVFNGNPISRNDIGSALNLPNLKSLSMSNCGLSDLTGVLKGVPNLESLVVIDNKITNLDSKCLPSSLRTLLLCGNPLSLPKAGSILNLPNLTSLSMSNCDIRELSVGALGGVPNLKILDLSKNQISIFPTELFFDVPQLVSIDLSYNRIQKFTNTTISQTCQIQSLNLAYNLISMGSERFLTAQYLISLNLDNNLIETVTTKTFSGLITLQVLSMVDHRIENVMSSYFNYLLHLTELNLENPKICLQKENLTELSNWAKSSNVSLNANCTSWSCEIAPVIQSQCMYV